MVLLLRASCNLSRSTAHFIQIQDFKYKLFINMTILNAYLMSKEHIIYNFLINDRGLIHQRINFPSGSTFLDPFEEEDEAIDRTEKGFRERSVRSKRLPVLVILKT